MEIVPVLRLRDSPREGVGQLLVHVHRRVIWTQIEGSNRGQDPDESKEARSRHLRVFAWWGSLACDDVIDVQQRGLCRERPRQAATVVGRYSAARAERGIDSPVGVVAKQAKHLVERRPGEPCRDDPAVRLDERGKCGLVGSIRISRLEGGRYPAVGTESRIEVAGRGESR